jgi:hypothetical protein
MKDSPMKYQSTQKFFKPKIKTTSLRKALIYMLLSTSFNKNMDYPLRSSCNNTDSAFCVKTLVIVSMPEFKLPIYGLVMKSLQPYI